MIVSHRILRSGFRTFTTFAILFGLLGTLMLWNFNGSEYRTNVSASFDVPHRHEVSDGFWVLSEEHRNDTIHWNHSTKCHDCKVPSKLIKNGLRVEDVDGWEWVLQDGTGLVEWDIERFVVRSLQSRVGFVFVGDSLTDGIFVALHMMLCLPNPQKSPRAFNRILEMGPVRLQGHPSGKEVYHNNLTMHENHPLKRKLLERWENKDDDLVNIPRSRFNQPIVRFWRNSNLASDEELDRVIVQEMGVPIDWTVQLRTLAPWRDDLARYADLPGWPGEKSGIAMINTGPHWEPGRFKPVTGDQMRQAYRSVISLIYDSLSSLPSSIPLRIQYRSTLPGHERCGDFLHPVTMDDPLAQNPTGNHTGTYHWHYFVEYNEVARDTWGRGKFALGIGDVDSEGASRNLTTEYWDVWNLGATRPDAHVAWTGKHEDCLHWCPASIYQWIVRAWWHTIVTESI